jgi:hypothetical protein
MPGVKRNTRISQVRNTPPAIDSHSISRRGLVAQAQ